MVLNFRNKRYPLFPEDLTTEEQQQLFSVAELYWGGDPEEYTLEGLMGGDDPDREDEENLMNLELWDIVDDEGNLQFTAWFYMADSGTIFVKKTTDVLGEVCQGGFDCHSSEDGAVYDPLLDDAKERAVALDPHTELSMVGFM